jgi:hypothetical protein
VPPETGNLKLEILQILIRWSSCRLLKGTRDLSEAFAALTRTGETIHQPRSGGIH